MIDPVEPTSYEKVDNHFHILWNIWALPQAPVRNYQNFPRITKNIWGEDTISFRRAHLLSGVAYISDILIDYRIHSCGTSQRSVDGLKNYFETVRLARPEILARLDQYKRDVLHRAPDNQCRCFEIIDAGIRHQRAMVNILIGGLFMSTSTLLSKLIFGRDAWRTKREMIKMFVCHWGLALPRVVDWLNIKASSRSK